MAKKDKRNYIAYADILRIVAAFSVVLLHAAGARITVKMESVESAEFLWAVIFNVATRWSVPVFVMLSGMLFLNKRKTVNIKNLYTKNILRMVTAFVFWSFVYNLYGALGETGKIIESVKLAFVRIPNGAMHTWFLFVIVGLYIVLPFVKRMTESMTKREAEYFILLSIVTSFLPKTLSSFAVFEPFITYLNKFEINYATFYVGLFVAGWYIDSFEHTKKFRGWVYTAGVAGFLYMLIVTVYYSRVRGVFADEFVSFKSFSAFLMAFAVMMLFKSCFANREFSRRTKSDLAFYSKYTFGIYLVHELFLNTSTAKGWYLLSDAPYFGIPLEAVIVFVLSLIVIGIISVFPFGKYIS